MPLFRVNVISKKSTTFEFVSLSDDGLVILRNVNGQEIDRTRKNIIKMFKDVGFSIDIFWRPWKICGRGEIPKFTN